MRFFRDVAIVCRYVERLAAAQELDPSTRLPCARRSVDIAGALLLAQHAVLPPPPVQPTREKCNTSELFKPGRLTLQALRPRPRPPTLCPHPCLQSARLHPCPAPTLASHPFLRSLLARPRGLPPPPPVWPPCGGTRGWERPARRKSRASLRLGGSSKSSGDEDKG